MVENQQSFLNIYIYFFFYVNWILLILLCFSKTVSGTCKTICSRGNVPPMEVGSCWARSGRCSSFSLWLVAQGKPNTPGVGWEEKGCIGKLLAVCYTARLGCFLYKFYSSCCAGKCLSQSTKIIWIHEDLNYLGSYEQTFNWTVSLSSQFNVLFVSAEKKHWGVQPAQRVLLAILATLVVFPPIVSAIFSKTLSCLQFYPFWWYCWFIYPVFCRSDYEFESSVYFSAQCG